MAMADAPVAYPQREFAQPQPRPAAPKQRERPKDQRPSPELPGDLDGEMSAMELAFAMAGAQADLEGEAAGDEDSAGREAMARAGATGDGES
jgi:hypothetical protein